MISLKKQKKSNKLLHKIIINNKVVEQVIVKTNNKWL